MSVALPQINRCWHLQPNLKVAAAHALGLGRLASSARLLNLDDIS